MTGAAPGADGPEDPLAADRRTLIIGAVAMVALVLVGVVSAQIFARGSCASVPAPEPAAAAPTAAPADTVQDVLGDVDGERVIDTVETIAGAPVATAVPVGDASQLAVLDGGLLATGTTVTSLGPDLAPQVTLDAAGDDRVVGSGAAVYDLTVSNPVSGQLDALVPRTGTELAAGTCVDTAVIGSPFAFLLGAADGQLLLLRADEEAEEPTLQLRDPEVGALWDAPLTLPLGSPGALGARVTGAIGPEAVVAARRVSPQEDVPAPAAIVVDRASGEVVAEAASPDLAAAGQLDPQRPLRWEVLAVGRTTALLAGRTDPQGALGADEDEATEPDSTLVVLDLTSGAATTAAVGVPSPGPVDVARGTDLPDRYAVATGAPDGDRAVLVVDGSGEVVAEEEALGPDLAPTWLTDDLVAVAGTGALGTVALGGAPAEVDPLRGTDVRDVAVTTDGRLAVLVAAPGGDDAVVLVTVPVPRLAPDEPEETPEDGGASAP